MWVLWNKLSNTNTDHALRKCLKLKVSVKEELPTSQGCFTKGKMLTRHIATWLTDNHTERFSKWKPHRKQTSKSWWNRAWEEWDFWAKSRLDDCLWNEYIIAEFTTFWRTKGCVWVGWKWWMGRAYSLLWFLCWRWNKRRNLNKIGYRYEGRGRVRKVLKRLG